MGKTLAWHLSREDTETVYKRMDGVQFQGHQESAS